MPIETILQQAANAASNNLQSAMAAALPLKLMSKDEFNRLKLLNKHLGSPRDNAHYATLLKEASAEAQELRARISRADSLRSHGRRSVPPAAQAPTERPAAPTASDTRSIDGAKPDSSEGPSTEDAPVATRCQILTSDLTSTQAKIRAGVVIAVQNGSISRRQAAHELRELALGRQSKFALILPEHCIYEVARKYRMVTASTVGRWVDEAVLAASGAAASGVAAAPLSETLRHGNARGGKEPPPVAHLLWEKHEQFPEISIAKIGEMLRQDGKTKLGTRQLQNIVRDSFGEKWLILKYGGAATEKELTDLRLAWEVPESNLVWIMDHSYLRVEPGAEGREHIPFWYLDDEKRSKQQVLMATALMDACSRRILNSRVWPCAPTSRENMLVLFEALRRYGKPRILYTDNGADLVSEEMREALIILGIELRTTLPGEPQGRGKLERWFRTMKEELLPLLPGYIARVNPKSWNVDDLLTRTEMESRLREYCDEYNNRVHGTTKQAPTIRFQQKLTVAGRAGVPLQDLLVLLPFKEAKRTVSGVEHAGKTWVGKALEQVLRDTYVRLYYDPFDTQLRHCVLESGESAHYLGTLTPHDAEARFAEVDKRITAHRNSRRLAR